MLEYAKNSYKPLVLGSDMGLMWCAVFEAEKDYLKSIYLIGPVYNAEVSVSFLEDSAERYHIDSTFRRQYVAIMKEISVVPSLMFQQYCLMLHYCVNGEKLNRSDIQFQPRNKVIHSLPSETETPTYDRAQNYLSEQMLLQLIREGNISYKQAIMHADHLFNPMYTPHLNLCKMPSSHPPLLQRSAFGKPFRLESPQIPPIPLVADISTAWPNANPFPI